MTGSRAREARPDPDATVAADAIGSTDTERWAAAATFAHRATLDPVETVLWRAERHPVLSGTNCIVVLLDEEPDWERFRAAHEWGTRLVRRLRQRILEPALPTTAPVWVDDESFRLDDHLGRRRAGGRGETADVLETAQSLALIPFDRSRALWEGTLLTGLAAGGAAYVLKIHHALADARGSLQLLSMLQSRTPRHTRNKPVGTSRARPSMDAATLAALGALAEVAGTPQRALAVARMGVSAVRNPGSVLTRGIRYAASVRRLVAPPPAPPSPLLGGRDGRTWRYLALAAPLRELGAAGRTAGGTLQDTFVAALLGGLRRYHELHGLTVDDLPVSIRVSLDRADDPMGGNRFAGAMIPAPAGVADPADRIAAVRGEVLSLHVEPALEAFRSFAPLASRLPSDVVAAVLQGGAVADMSVATNAGPTQTSYMAGARVVAMYSFGPLPGVALSASLLSYGDTACIGVTVDGRAVEDLEVLRRCVEEGLDEVLALAR